MTNIESLIKKLDLQPHPEGGYFREVYRSEGAIKEDNLSSLYTGKRNYATSIYFLLTSANFSAFHKINQDEIWHFYSGSPIRLHMISPRGMHSEHLIGNDLALDQAPQLVVPGGFWFAAEVEAPSSYALVGCTVSPGFDFEDFVLADRNALCARFPQHQKLIQKYTRI